MAEPIQGKPEIIRRLCFVVIFGVLVVFAVLICSHPNSPSIDKQLAAIEATRAIPDSENAAILYERLLKDPNARSFEHRPDSMRDESYELDFRQPWSGRDYPELAALVKENQWLIDKLLSISEFEKCRFPVYIDLYRSVPIDRISVMRKWAFLVARAANNDADEGRIDEAIVKWRCIIRMASHLYQQPTSIEMIIGISLEQLGIVQLTVLLVESNVDEEHLTKIQSLSLPTSDNWAAILNKIQTIDKLIEQKAEAQFSLVGRLKFKFQIRQFRKFIGTQDPFHEKTHWLYLRALARRRLIHILVSLRRYRNQNDRWPASLEEIRPQVKSEALVDPFTKGDFVYELTEDGFTLYSKGENGIDDGGRRGTVSGIGSKLPKGVEDDILFWPVRRSPKPEDPKDKTI